MYNLLSGPNAMAVGRFSPVTIVRLAPDGLILITSPVPGVGKGLPVVFSRTYIAPAWSKSIPKIALKPVATTLMSPEGVTL
jgi:hypothetical protein